MTAAPSTPWFRQLLGLAADRCREPARGWVLAARRAQPSLGSDELAARAVSRDSAVAGAVGGVAGLVTMVPGLGSLLGLVSSTPENLFITYRRLQVIVYVAAAYGRPLEGPEFVDQMLLVLGAASGVARARSIVEAVSAHKELGRCREHLTDEISRRLLQETSRRVALTGGLRLLRRIPFLSLPLSISLDYTLVSGTGLSARYFFNDMRYSPAELTDLALTTYRKQKAMVCLMAEAARADGALGDDERGVIAELKGLLVVPPSERATLDRELAARHDPEALAALFPEEDRALVMRNILRVTLADLVKTPEEQAWVERLRRALDLPAAVLARLEDEVMAERRR